MKRTKKPDRSRRVFQAGRWSLIALLVLASGCQWGPGVMQVSHEQYSQAVRQINSKQILLNLVRLRYSDAPVFLEITNISTQFVFRQGAGVGATLTENVGGLNGKNPDLFNLNGEVGYEERPTISYTIPNSRAFLTGLLTPIEVDQLALLAESGWSGSAVFRLAVDRVNALENAPPASGPTPSAKPKYAEFLEAVRLMHILAGQDLIGFQYEERTEIVSDPLPPNALDTAGMSELMKLGVEFELTDDGRYVMAQKKRVLVLRFAERAAESAEAARLRELLRLDPGQVRFDLIEYDDCETDDLDPGAQWSDLAMNTRSVLGIMFYMSKAVRIPEEHLAAGLAPQTRDKAGNLFDWSELIGDLFIVHASKKRPENAALRVYYKGYWFYIRADDHESKSTFTLLLALSSLSSVEVETTKPVLTLPVGGA